MSTKHGQGTSKLYSCDHQGCSYKTNRKDALTAHQVKQHGKIIPEDEMIKCTKYPQCKQTFNTGENMRKHYKLICQKGADVKCIHPGCSRMFKNEVQMKYHYKVHTTKGKEWYCQICKKQFSSKQSFDHHNKRHT